MRTPWPVDKLHFSLRVNCKKIAAGNRSTRDQQFRQITRLRSQFSRHGNPIISVDAKKRELARIPHRTCSPSEGGQGQVADNKRDRRQGGTGGGETVCGAIISPPFSRYSPPPSPGELRRFARGAPSWPERPCVSGAVWWRPDRAGRLAG